MSEELKWAIAIFGTLIIIVAASLVYHNRAARIDAAAPVVETCVKHPVTVSPFKPSY